MENYALIKESNIIERLSDNAFIPFDPANTDYQEFVQWCEQGNSPLPADIASQVSAMENEVDNAV
jgi:hypothetical protein